MKQLKGSALPTVMVVSILICLLILFAFTLFDINALLYIGYQYGRQRKEFLNSAFVLYCRDSTFAESLNNQAEYQLYKEDDASTVRFDISPWGLYEVVRVSSADQRFRSVRLLGKKEENLQKAGVWICSRDAALSIAGNSRITGVVFAPLNGINYIRIEDKPFSGEAIPEYNVRLAEPELPVADSIYLNQMSIRYEKMKSDMQSLPADSKLPYCSFFKETSCFVLSGKTEGLTVRGNAILYADEVTVSSESNLTDVILIARKVIVEKGFAGSMQIMASDTVIVEENVQLRYPSGILVNGNAGKTYLEMGTESSLEGYAIIKGTMEKENSLHILPNYKQANHSFLGGLLYVDGIATISGTISGATYIKECYYLPVNGSYAGTLFNVKISRNEQAAFPFFFKLSPYRRQEIKTLR